MNYQEIEQIEKDIIQDKKLCDLVIREYIWTNDNTRINVFRNKNYYKNKQGIICIHGIYGSSFTFLDLFKTELLNKFNLYMVDLPGFGRTDLNNITGNDNAVNGQGPFTNYCTVLDTVIEYFHVKNPVLCCHSFGSYLGITYLDFYINICLNIWI